MSMLDDASDHNKNKIKEAQRRKQGADDPGAQSGEASDTPVGKSQSKPGEDSSD